MLLKIQHEKNDKNIRDRVSSIYKGALKQKDLTLRVVAESVGYTKVEKGINRINRLIDAGELPQQEGDLQYKICRMLGVEEAISSLVKEMEAESISYQSALQKEKDLLQAHLPSILAHSDRIRADSEMRYALISEHALAGGAYIGGGYLPLGLLLEFWQRDKFTEKCSACGGRAYLYGAGGSPLSGSGSMRGICIGCLEESEFAFNAKVVIALKKHESFEPFQELISNDRFMRIEELVDRLDLAISQGL